MPIEITESQSGNLAGADAKARQHRQDREVPYSNWRGTVTTRQKPHYVLGLQSPRQIPAPTGKLRHGRRKILPGPALDVQEPQESAQPRNHVVSVCHAAFSTLVQNESADGGRGKLRQTDRDELGAGAKKHASHTCVVAHDIRRQAAFLELITPKSI